CGGTNIYPDDVANILRALPGVADAAVWGEEDPAWGETVHAAVTPNPGETLDPAKLSQEYLKRAGMESAPRKIHVAADFPRGPAGKVIVADLRAQIKAAQNEKRQCVEGGTERAIIAIAARIFKCDAET